MKKIISKFKYSKDGHDFVIETERFGKHGFDIFVSAPDFGADRVESYIPYGFDDVIMLSNFRHQGKRLAVKPPQHVMQQIYDAKKQAVAGNMEYFDQRAKEKEWDRMYNDGGEGYNPYRSSERPIFAPEYKGDETPE